jgi:hypothetical protein
MGFISNIFQKIFSSQNNNEEQIEKPEENLTSEKKGQQFEELIVSKFAKRYFVLKEWRSDKIINGRYAESNKNPDLEFEFKFKNITKAFAVECKWRQNYYKNGINWTKKAQFERYKDFANAKKIPVFIIIGVGGTPKKPDEIFIIPLRKIKFTFIKITFLEAFKKKDKDKNFFFDANSEILK